MKKKLSEFLVEKFIMLCGLTSIFIIISIVLMLFSESFLFFANTNLFYFFFGTCWSPGEQISRYGLLPLLSGTFMIVFFSSIISIPFGLCTAMYISEYAHKKHAKIIRPILELLAGIPSVVYGFFALKYITPFLKNFFPSINIFNALSAAIAVGIMIIPTITSLTEDALRSVPRDLREAGYSLGLNKSEVVKGILIPSSLSGIVASFILGISRAVGETMIVAIAAGATPLLSLNPLDSIQTMTGYIINTVQGEVVVGTFEYRTIYAVALVLFFVTLILNYLTKKLMYFIRKY